MKKQSLLKSTIIFLVILGFFSIGFLGCTEKQPPIPTKSELPAGLLPEEEAALLAGVYTLEDLASFNKLIAAGNVEKIEVSPFKFFIPGDRYQPAKEVPVGIVIPDKKNIASLRLFTTKVSDSEAKKNIIEVFTVGAISNFDSCVLKQEKGFFCPKLPGQEVAIYHLKCFVNGHVRYLIVANSVIEGENCYAVFYNYSFPNPNIGDVVGIFLSTLERIRSS